MSFTFHLLANFLLYIYLVWGQEFSDYYLAEEAVELTKRSLIENQAVINQVSLLNPWHAVRKLLNPGTSEQRASRRLRNSILVQHLLNEG